ncbi:MAG: hypothetical protein FWD74_00685 [Actinomycetia bacterium]|nr:hypothetical protein [Actinomycetes bacterium]
MRIEVIRRPESEIDKRQLALALIALARDLEQHYAQPENRSADRRRPGGRPPTKPRHINQARREQGPHQIIPPLD